MSKIRIKKLYQKFERRRRSAQPRLKNLSEVLYKINSKSNIFRSKKKNLSTFKRKKKYSFQIETQDKSEHSKNWISVNSSQLKSEVGCICCKKNAIGERIRPLNKNNSIKNLITNYFDQIIFEKLNIGEFKSKNFL